MKKIILLLVSITVCLSVSAQERFNNSTAFILSDQAEAQPINKKITPGALHDLNKTTTPPTSRWYNYADWLNMSTNGATAFSSSYMWNDTASVDVYSGGTVSHNRFVSVASVLDPYFSGFYDDLYYPVADNMAMASNKPYTVDSLMIYGFYGVNPVKTGVVDTITIGYTYGTGADLNNTTQDIWKRWFDSSFALSVLTRYNLNPGDSLWYKNTFYDSTRNTGGGIHFAKQVFTISSAGPSTNTTANWGDTLSNGLFAKKIGLTTPMNVPAGNLVAVTISFKSGDASFVVDDTVFRGSTFTGGSIYKYNMFRALLEYNTASSGSTTAIYAAYNNADHNTGLFKTLPNFANGWANRYVPLWAWTSSGGPSTLQYSYTDVHIKCPTCTTSAVQDIRAKNTINAFPNPAANQLNISFSLANMGNTSVTLTNMVGQVVATQDMGNVMNGTAVFNTAVLPAGVYIYNIQHNGARSAGRVLVAH